jgi:hypothetical protein
MDNYQFKIVTNDLEHIDQYLNDFASIHQSAYSNSHFTSLFSSNKLKQYYKALIQCSDLSLIIYADEKALGFIVSGINVSRGVSVFKRLNRFYLAILLVSNPKFLIEKIVANIFNIEEFAEQFNLQKVSYRTFIGFILLPINIYLFYNNTPSNIIIYFTIAVILIINLFSYLVSLKIYQNLLIGKLFYFILYLCALEIAPYYFMYYLITKNLAH